jgi:hypothetical protein
MTSGGAQLVFRFDLFGVLSSAAVVALQRISLMAGPR